MKDIIAQPYDLNSAVRILYDALEVEDRETIVRSKAIQFHHGFGTGLRNRWLLWDRSTPIVQWFIESFGLGHADDISGIILEALWARVCGEEFDPLVLVERYKEHWSKSGVNPVTGEKVDVGR